jgi:hypothetical protein
MNPIDTFYYYLCECKTVDDLHRLAERMKVDIEQNETFRSVADELREMWAERLAIMTEDQE